MGTPAHDPAGILTDFGYLAPERRRHASGSAAVRLAYFLRARSIALMMAEGL
jgi:hypothetical protein